MPGVSQSASCPTAPVRRAEGCTPKGVRQFDGSLEAICADCLPPVRRFVHSRVREPEAAEDLVGEIFERGVRAWHTFEGRSTARAWFLGIARHVIADHRRDHPRRPISIESLSTRGGPASPEDLERSIALKNEIEVLGAIVARLAEDEQELLALRYVSELSYHEIGEVFGLRADTVRVQMHRVMKRIRKQMGDWEE